jgi:hypothetical protein
MIDWYYKTFQSSFALNKFIYVPSDRACAHPTRTGFFPYFFSVLFFPYFSPVFFSSFFFPPYFFPRTFFPVLFFPYFLPRINFPYFSPRTYSKVTTFEIERFKISVSFSSTYRYSTVHVPCGISIQTSPVL